MQTVIKVKPLNNHLLWVLFADNFDATIDIKPFIKSGISAKLSDLNYFRQVKIDEFGGITWENGFDFCPNYLREIIEKQKDFQIVDK